RLGHPLQGLAAQPPPHEGPQALVGIETSRQHEVEGHPELARPGEEAGAEKGAEARGREELEAIGQRMQAAPEDDEDAPQAIVGAGELVLNAEPPTELERPGLLGEKRVGAALHEEAVAPLRLDGAAQPIGGLEEAQLEVEPALARQLAGTMGRGEPGDAAADDGQLHARATFTPVPA